MTVETGYSSKTYKPGSAMAAEAIGFQFMDPRDLIVTHIADADGSRTLLTYGDDYIVAGDGMAVPAQGTLRATSPWPANDLFEIGRASEMRQRQKIPAHQPVPSAAFQQAIDRDILILQEQAIDLARSVRVPAGEAGIILPGSDLRAGQFFVGLPDGSIGMAGGTGADNGLRQDMASPLSGKGASLLAMRRATPSQLLRSAEADIANFVWGNTAYGADPTGLLSSATALQNAISEKLALGGDLRLPPGVFLIDETISFRDFVRFRGSGCYATVLAFTSPDAFIAAMAGAEFHDLRIHTLAGVTRTLGAPFVTVLKNAARFVRCNFSSYALVAEIGDLPGDPSVNVTMSECGFFNPQSGAGNGAIFLRNFASFQADHIIATGYIGTQQPDSFLRIWQGDTATISNSNITGHGKAMWIDTPAGYNCYAVKSSNVLFDSAGTISGGFAASCVDISPAGGAHSVVFDSCWLGLSAGASGLIAQPTGSGVIVGLQVNGCEALGNAVDGILLNGNIRQPRICDNQIGDNGYGVRLIGALRDLTMVGNQIGDVYARGPNLVNVEIATGSTVSGLIACNNLAGASLSNLNDGADVAADLEIVSNKGYNDLQPISVVTTGASPWTYRAGHAPEIVYLSSGTVSDIKVSGVTVATASNTAISLNPGQLMVVTYSAVPTVKSAKVM